MLRPIFVLTLLGTVFAVASCGDDGSTTTSTTTTSSSSSGGVTAEEACSALATSVCDVLNGCSTFLIERQYGDIAGCRERQAATCASISTIDGSNTTPEFTQACADAFSAVTCDELLLRKFPSACDFPAGDLADGSACGREVQCASTHCNKGGATCGVCSSEVAAGGTCKSSDDCEPGLLCASGKCVPPAAAGETCDSATPCLPTLACSGGKCGKPAEAGEACVQADQNCNILSALGCNSMDICQQVKIAAPGEACGLAGGNPTICSNNGQCAGMMGGVGTCMAAADDGEACDAVNGPPCKVQSICTNGTCKLDDGLSCK